MMRSLCVVASCLGIAQASSYDVETFGSTEAAIAQVEARHETFRGLQVRLLRDALCLSNSSTTHASAPRPTRGGLVATDARAAAPSFP